MTTWNKIARRCYNDYGTFVDKDDYYFLCPHCGEPIYDCDWREEDYFVGDGVVQCPICEEVLVEEL